MSESITRNPTLCISPNKRGRPKGSKDNYKRHRRPKTTINEFRETEWLERHWHETEHPIYLEPKHLLELEKMYDLYRKSPLVGKQWPKKYDHLVARGILYGYKNCCIMSFLKGFGKKRQPCIPELTEWLLLKTEMLACNDCLIQKTHNQIITETNQRRHNAITPFSVSASLYFQCT